jgi:hypothetical protein
VKWFQMDSDATDDPKIKAIFAKVGHVGISGLFHLWCFVARYGSRPGWSLDAKGQPMPRPFLEAGSKLSRKRFAALLDVLCETNHISRKNWTDRGVVVFPAMVKRSDTYTQRRLRKSANGVRTVFAQGAKIVPPTIQDKTIQRTNTVGRAAPNHARAREKPKAPKTPGPYRHVLRIARQLLTEQQQPPDFASLKDDLKLACATRGVPYDAEVVGKAAESAIALQRKARRA